MRKLFQESYQRTLRAYQGYGDQQADSQSRQGIHVSTRGISEHIRDTGIKKTDSQSRQGIHVST